ncbi:Rrf2 family transcriptional regulator [uncultured Megasphaera sp.]|uniref:RrF2 family transcriptional regulator n=1 Tax=uncultured Megasphaera sp. TaxID=165188 RepID=UPI0026597AF6|nr:Rrf2 family transcriptional regulator [uncultured Megasphaera sp.]
MRLNQATDYAFRMVLYLAAMPEGTKITGSVLAAKQNIPERFLLKIMRSLTAAGIMKSYRGVDGGFALQRSPRDITLFDVIEAVEGQTELQRCLHDLGSCSRGCSGMCSIYAAFSEIQMELANKLKSINFADLAEQEEKLKTIHELEQQQAAGQPAQTASSAQ